jgi:SPP1 gp7 family putative phage head morphogenesis protein
MTQELTNGVMNQYKANEQQSSEIQAEMILLLAIVTVLSTHILSNIRVNRLLEPMSQHKRKKYLEGISGMTKDELRAISHLAKTPMDLISLVAKIQFDKIRLVSKAKVEKRLTDIAHRNIQEKMSYLTAQGLKQNTVDIDVSEIVKAPYVATSGSNELNENFLDLMDKQIDKTEQKLFRAIAGYSASPTERLLFSYQADHLGKGLSQHVKNVLRNESTRIIGDTNFRIYEAFGVTYYRFEAVLDANTSDICNSLNGSVFRVDERKVGSNASSMHFNCRSTELPVV